MIAGTRFSVTTELSRQQKLSAEIAQLQTDISSGIKVRVASDDPVAARRIAQIRGTQASQTTWATNITIAKQISSQVEDSLSGIQTTLTRAKELLLAANTDTASAAGRTALAGELKGILDELDTVSKTTDFTGTPLYAAPGNPVAIPVGPDLAISAAESASRVFGSVKLPDGTTTSIAAILTTAIAALQTGDRAGMTTSTTAIDSALSHNSDMLVDAGIRSQRIGAASERLETARLDLKEERSAIEDTDTTAAAAELVQKRTQLDASQSIMAMLSRTSLFDKLA